MADYNLELVQNTWMHLGISKEGSKTAVFINIKKILIDDLEFVPEAREIIIGDGHSIQLDEMMVDTTVALDLESFIQSSQDKVPWGTLDYLERHLIIDAFDPDNIKGNIFSGQSFKDAVLGCSDTLAESLGVIKHSVESGWNVVELAHSNICLMYRAVSVPTTSSTVQTYTITFPRTFASATSYNVQLCPRNNTTIISKYSETNSEGNSVRTANSTVMYVKYNNTGSYAVVFDVFVIGVLASS